MRMKDKLYDSNSVKIESISRSYADLGRFHSRCISFLEVAERLGYNDVLLDKLRDKEKKKVIVPGDDPHSGDTHQRELLIELSNLIQRRCRSIIERAKEIEEDGDNNTMYSLKSDLDSISLSLGTLSTQKSDLSNYIYNWESLNSKTFMHKRILEGVRFYLNELQKKIALNKEDREVLKQHGIDYRYRLSGLNNHDKRINVHFHINDVKTNVFMCDGNGVIDEDKSFVVPYGDMGDGKAYPVHVKLSYNLYDIVKVVSNYYLDIIENGSNDSSFEITDIAQLRPYGVPFKIVAVCNALSKKGVPLKFLFIDRWGNSGIMPCFGEMDNMLYGAANKMNFVDYGSLLRSWVSTFRVGYTNPFNHPPSLYAGVPRKYGSLAEDLGQNTEYCRNTFINDTKDCINADCALMSGGKEDRPRCNQFQMMSDLEAIAAQHKLNSKKAKKEWYEPAEAVESRGAF